MKIDFTHLPVRQSLGNDKKIVVDMKASFADVVYTRGTGIEAHSLAFKIYNGENDFNERECELIEYYAGLCAPFFIDAITEILKQEK